jgi:hypothetical protein
MTVLHTIEPATVSGVGLQYAWEDETNCEPVTVMLTSVSHGPIVGLMEVMRGVGTGADELYTNRCLRMRKLP